MEGMKDERTVNGHTFRVGDTVRVNDPGLLEVRAREGYTDNIGIIRQFRGYTVVYVSMAGCVEITDDLYIQPVEEEKVIHICTHFQPDGDAIGSVFGMSGILECAGIECEVHLWGEVPRWFEKVHTFLGLPAYTTDPVPENSVIYLLDASDRSRCQDSVPDSASISLLIDHHPIKDEKADIYFHDTSASSTCQLITEWAIHNLYTIPPGAASWLALGIRTDTLSFATKTTSADTHETMSVLIERGARTAEIAALIHRSMTLDLLRYQADVVLYSSRIRNSLVMSAGRGIRDYYGVNTNDAKVALYPAGQLMDIDLVVLMIEGDNPDEVFMSFRSQSERARSMALAFGGGGHPQASGANVKDSLGNLIRRVAAYLEGEANA